MLIYTVWKSLNVCGVDTLARVNLRELDVLGVKWCQWFLLSVPYIDNCILTQQEESLVSISATAPPLYTHAQLMPSTADVYNVNVPCTVMPPTKDKNDYNYIYRQCPDSTNVL